MTKPKVMTQEEEVEIIPDKFSPLVSPIETKTPKKEKRKWPMARMTQWNSVIISNLFRLE
jgi:hypothetical protein